MVSRLSLPQERLERIVYETVNYLECRNAIIKSGDEELQSKLNALNKKENIWKSLAGASLLALVTSIILAAQCSSMPGWVGVFLIVLFAESLCVSALVSLFARKSSENELKTIVARAKTSDIIKQAKRSGGALERTRPWMQHTNYLLEHKIGLWTSDPPEVIQQILDQLKRPLNSEMQLRDKAA